MIKIFLVLSISLLLFGADKIMPQKSFKANGAVTDLVYKNNLLYVATSASLVDIFDVKENKILDTIKVSKIKDFMGDEIDAKIYSVDVLDGRVLVLSQAEHGFREVDIYTKKDGMKKIIDASKKLYIAKAKFIDKETILLGLLSNDIISYNIKTGKYNWNLQASQSKFSNFQLNEDKSKVVIADESGDLHILNVKDGTLIKTLSGQNLDNVFQVDYKNGTVLSGGQDRRVVVYDIDASTAYYKKSSFIVYSVGLSPSAKIAAYSSDENNNVTLFKTSTESKIGVCGGNNMIITNILFINDKELFISSDDTIINYYKLK
jgi:outer membrane protein assembly factor BamB